MSAEFESPVSSLGESVFRNLRNAVVRFNGGEGVDAIFRNLSQPSLLGQAGAWVRTPELICLSADVADVEEGQAAEVVSIAASVPFYTVRERRPAQQHADWVSFALELAA